MRPRVPRVDGLAGTDTERRLRKYLRQALERRSNRSFDDVVAAMRKAALAPPPGMTRAAERLVTAGANVANRLRAAPAWFRSSLLRKLDANDWARVLQTALSERLWWNIRGAIREQALGASEEMSNLVSRMEGKLVRANARAFGQWRVPPLKVRGALSQSRVRLIPSQELGDYLVVAIAGKPVPKLKGVEKQIWIMAVVECKSPTNMYDAFEQLRADVHRISKQGLIINGIHYAPERIAVDLPAERLDPADWTTELVAAVPRDIRGTSRVREATKGIVINVWRQDLDDRDLDYAAKKVEEVLAELGSLFD